MLRGAIFDLDGTLLDSMPVWNTSASTYLLSIGLMPWPGVDAAVSHLSLQQVACYFQTAYGVALTERQIVDGILALIRRFYETEVRPKPGVPAFLRELSQRNVKMCIATATDVSLAKAALARCGLLDYFIDIISCADVGSGKDQPLIYREALARLGTFRSETLVFEDALHALQTAKADGFLTVAVHDDSEPDWERCKRISTFAMGNFTQAKTFWDFADKL